MLVYLESIGQRSVGAEPMYALQTEPRKLLGLELDERYQSETDHRGRAVLLIDLPC
jgi:hypothetical protein